MKVKNLNQPTVSEDVLDGTKLKLTGHRKNRYKRTYTKDRKPRVEIPQKLYGTIWLWRTEKHYPFSQIAQMLFDGWKVDVTPRTIAKLVKRLEAKEG